MSNIISKTFEVETAHIVRNAISERCKHNIHGHSYKIEVSIIGRINEETGMVLDFKELSEFKNFVDKFDHSTILWNLESDDIKSFFLHNFKRVIIMEKNCTAENMARLLFKKFSEILMCNDFSNENVCIHEVKVWETRNSCAIADEYDNMDNIYYIQCEG